MPVRWHFRRRGSKDRRVKWLTNEPTQNWEQHQKPVSEAPSPWDHTLLTGLLPPRAWQSQNPPAFITPGTLCSYQALREGSTKQSGTRRLPLSHRKPQKPPSGKAPGLSGAATTSSLDRHAATGQQPAKRKTELGSSEGSKGMVSQQAITSSSHGKDGSALSWPCCSRPSTCSWVWMISQVGKVI